MAASWLFVIACGLLADPRALLAIEGVIEINNAVVGTFPYSITASGTYRLTGNLTVTSGADGIDVSADNVTIDLNGFAIIGVSGSGTGIKSTNNQVTVRNGTVTGMGGAGISLGGTNATVTGVHSVGNGGAGIVIGSSSLVTDSTVSGNQGVGISVTGSGSTVLDNSVYGNSSYGLELNDISSSFARNVFQGNNGNSTIGSLSPPQVAPPPSGSNYFQIGSNLCNGDACP